FFAGDSKRDLSVRFHGRRAATPLGPAAGPHSQMAQNIVLAWLGGSRIIELKTVQILDELKIPRPCIDMQNVGYNVEWSQELKLEQSLEEYVKASMLIRMLEASGKLSLSALSGGALFDMSVGYDLKGIQSERVQSFIRGMKDCSALIDRQRPQIPAQYKSLRDLDFDARLSGTLTLSTFHGCPPEEIERIILFLLETNSLDCVVKLNPTLLGKDEVRRILTGILGYRDLRVPDAAFEKDAKWEQASAFVERLRKRAAGLGRSFGRQAPHEPVAHDVHARDAAGRRSLAREAVALAREKDHLHFLAQPFQRLVEHLRFGHIAAVVLQAVRDHERCRH
ncbi:MAG: hypothetical protein AAB576_05210, partial [Elusimicrobiota bacterium]